MRDTILKLLSEDELRRVGTAGAGARLSHGDQYIDLEQLHHGVRRAIGTTKPMGHVVPRDDVHEVTWSKILKHVAAYRLAPSK
jgi:hypothetical protein